MSAGMDHTCGVTAAGDVYCWGSNGYGQLGDGDTTDRPSPGPVAGGTSFAAVSAGGRHTCGVMAVGATLCWGANYWGQLGNGTTTIVPPVTSPGPVMGIRLAAVSAGMEHTCGVTAAGAAYCWGLNVRGQLGDGTTTDRPSPVLVAGGLSFAAVSAGGAHTCGVTAAGAAYCWSVNIFGQLGNGTTSDSIVQSSPGLVVGGVSFAAVSAGGEHTCGVTAAGAAYCWGVNDYGQVGDGDTTDWTPRSSPVLVTGGLSFVAVSAGTDHTCGVTTSGAAYCWGADNVGQLGDGTITYFRSSPARVTGGVRFAAVSLGPSYSCGVTTAGAAYCWGANYGSSPVRVSLR